MTWNGVAMAQHFLKLANALHPQDAFSETERVMIQAKQDLYYECYMSSFDEHTLMDMLGRILSGVIKHPESVKGYHELYELHIAQEARVVMKSLQK